MSLPPALPPFGRLLPTPSLSCPFFGSATASLLAAATLVACSAGPTTPPREAPATAEPAATTVAEPPPALSPEETKLKAELERDVNELAGRIGERNVQEPWGLADAADFLVAELEQIGYAVERQGYEMEGAVAMNLEVTVPGGRRGQQVVVVGAHYDSARGTPGANDNASGVAALLALARRFYNVRHERTIRLVFFTNEEPPYFQTSQMGSMVYAKKAVGRGDDIWLMLSLESLGYYSDEPGSQRYPDGVDLGHPAVGNFLAVVGNLRSKRYTDLTVELLSKHSTLPIEGAVLPEDTPGVGWSDQWAFWQLGIAGVMLTDTAPFRYPHYHQAEDTPDKLDYERFTRAVSGLQLTLTELAGGRFGAD